MRSSHVIAIVAVFACVMVGRGAENKKPPLPLQLPALFDARLAELSVPSVGINYLKAVDMCTHWGGEEPYDKERAEEITKGIESSCGQTEMLKKKFLSSKPNKKISDLVSTVAKDLEQGQPDVFSIDYFIWKDPEGKSKTMKAYYESRAQ